MITNTTTNSSTNLQKRKKSCIPLDSGIIVEMIKGEDLPEDLIQLRKDVYTTEVHWLEENKIIDQNDTHGVHFISRSKETGEILGALTYIDAEKSDFSTHTKIAKDKLTSSFYITRALVKKEFRRLGFFSLLVYTSCRYARMQGRKNLVSFYDNPESAAPSIMKPNFMQDINPRKYSNNENSYELQPSQQEVNHAMHRAFQAMPKDLQNWAAHHYFTDELIYRVKEKTQIFYKNNWVKSIENGTLTKLQYIETLSNTHQYVRWTTRLLGQVVGITKDPELRAHYIRHLSGEIDHEVMIENDLRALGADLDYHINHNPPNSEIYQFMCVQESMSGFRRDPLLFLAVPLGMEAITAFMPHEFIKSLKDCIKSWGVKTPAKACSFFSSHIHTDGGDDGHWQATYEILQKTIKTEYQLRWMLNITDIILDSMTRAYSKFNDFPDLTRTHLPNDLSFSSNNQEVH